MHPKYGSILCLRPNQRKHFPGGCKMLISMEADMDRRIFLGALSGLGALPSLAGAAPEKKTRFYVLEQMFLKNGSQLPRIHETIGKTMLPLLNAVHTGPKIYLEALVAPQFAAIYGFESLEDMWGTHVKLAASEEFRRKSEEFESGPEPPFEHQTNTLLLAADYSPEIVPAPASAQPRIFELRTYHSPTWRQLRALHERFAGPEIKIFGRCGIHPILYSSTIFGANMPNLTYLIPFDNLAAREKAWNAFGADPEWLKVRNESIEKHGQISSVIEISIHKAAPYSPVR